MITPTKPGILILALQSGERVILSTPPAIIRFALPVSICIAAWLMASTPSHRVYSPLHLELLSGRPASNRDIRATLRLSSPA